MPEVVAYSFLQLKREVKLTSCMRARDGVVCVVKSRHSLALQIEATFGL